MNKNFIITFLGPDGSGKSTTIDYLIKYFKKKNLDYKYIHLRPRILKHREKPVTNPHGKKPRSSFLSFIKLVYWLILFNFYFLFVNLVRKKIYVFDRYPHDLLVDPLRYRFKLNKKLAAFMLNFLPLPDLWINMSGNSNVIWKRKKEIKQHIIKKQLKSYKKFFNNKINTIEIKKKNDYLKIINYLVNKI